MPGPRLDRRALNRALLARQMLLCRVAAPAPAGRAQRVLAAVGQLAGLQAQAPFPPYFGLWSRLADFRPAELAELITGRRVVRIALMRGTIHAVTAADCLAMRPLIQPVLDRGLRANFGRQLAGVDLASLAAAGRELVEAAPLTFSELGARLAERWPAKAPAALAQGVRAMVPLVQVPPRGIWGRSGAARHTSAEAWLGQPLDQRATPDWLVRRYLAAFGPATVQDAQTWSGLAGLGEVVERLRPGLRVFRDEHGRELFDLPEAPRPDPATPAPIRLVAEFDNLVLSHADRSRVISDDDRKKLFSRQNVFPGTVLVDGFAAGMWRLSRAAGAAAVTVELFRPISSRDGEAIAEEGQRLLGFAAAGTAGRDIRIVNLS
jgi:Winged helix DNA-binding domain